MVAAADPADVESYWMHGGKARPGYGRDGDC
jgi:hypothetical protein